MRRGAHIATSIGLLAVGLALLLPASAPAKKGNGKASAAKAEKFVRTTLASRRLTPTRTRCHYGGGGFACQWRATRVIRAWTFHCRGRAWRGPKRRSVQACRMQGPVFAPLIPPDQLGNWQPSFGLNEDWVGQVGRVDMASGLGANTNRVPVDWAMVEPQRDRYNWAPFDRVYNAMRSRGMTPLLAVSGSPCWARPERPCTDDPAYPPNAQNLGQWAQFITRTIERYPGIAGIEVWNEPNLTGFWLPKPSPKDYARLLKVTAKAVNKVNPGVPVIFGGLVPQFGPAPRGMDSRIFQKRAYKAGVGRYVDAFAVHPYVFPSNDPYLIPGVRLQMAIPKGIAAHFGHPGTPLWVTEFGLSTVGDGKVSPADQATRLVALYELLRQIPGVPVVILHRLIDLSPSDPDWQAGMGLVTYRGTPKPSYCAIAKARTGSCPFN